MSAVTIRRVHFERMFRPKSNAITATALLVKYLNTFKAQGTVLKCRKSVKRTQRYPNFCVCDLKVADHTWPPTLPVKRRYLGYLL
jgi:hypothetical protein